MDALLLLLAFGAGLAAATQILVNGSISEQKGAPEALLVSVTVTYGVVVWFMLARFLTGGGLNLRIPAEPLIYLLPLAVIAAVAFAGVMRGFEWYHFLGGLAGAVIVLVSWLRWSACGGRRDDRRRRLRADVRRHRL
jgi:uncharacterized membrane protein YdcZ (DUF606 family)